MDKLIDLVEKMHKEAYELCMSVFNKYFSNAGNIGVFCQSDEEYKKLLELSKQITKPSGNIKQKYYELNEPIVISEKSDTPSATYTHLYIRKPDSSPYGKHRGDIDFYVDDEKYNLLLKKVGEGKYPKATIYEQEGVGEMIELESSEIETLSYLSTKAMTEIVRVKQ